MIPPMPGDPLRVLAVSHAAVIPINQEPFDALARAGADVTVVAPDRLATDLRGTVRLEALEGSAATLQPLRVRFGGYSRAVGQRGIHVIVYDGLRRVVARVRPDVIFVEEEPFSFAAWQTMRAARGIPFVVHENQNLDRPLPPPFAQIRRAVLARAAGATVRNEAARDLLRRAGFRGPIGALPHAVDPKRYEGHDRRTDLPPPVVGFVGRLVEEKGIFDLIAAARTMRCSLLIVGDGPARAEAERRAAGMPVRFVGAVPHDEVPSWYASMDVVAIPSRRTATWMEQFGRIVIEANAAGVPVIASDSGALGETVRATGGGSVVPEGHPAALARAIASLEPDRARALGEAGRAVVAERFTPTAVARDLLVFLREVAA